MRELPDAGFNDRLLVLLRKYAEIRIEGDSMLPVLASGDRVVVDPTAEPTIGDLVVAYHPFKKSVSIVKRVVEITPEGRLVLLGDNLSESTDSRAFGSITAEDVYGTVVSRIR